MRNKQDIQTNMGVHIQISGEEEERIKLVNRDSDNLLVS